MLHAAASLNNIITHYSCIALMWQREVSSHALVTRILCITNSMHASIIWSCSTEDASNQSELSIMCVWEHDVMRPDTVTHQLAPLFSRRKMLMRSREETPAFKAQTPAIWDRSSALRTAYSMRASLRKRPAPLPLCALTLTNQSAERKVLHEY